LELEDLSEVVKTPKGDIEYRKWGNAPYMLMMPGTPGNCHCTVGFHQYGFGLITVSRPGYGQTPLTADNRTAEAQADLIMALMDHIEIEKLPVMAASAAGVIALRMAIQYPERIQCLLMNCATTGQYKYKWLE
jgi:pimeloyl-ACP methyl ester carboxylesterase